MGLTPDLTRRRPTLIVDSKPDPGGRVEVIVSALLWKGLLRRKGKDLSASIQLHGLAVELSRLESPLPYGGYAGLGKVFG